MITFERIYEAYLNCMRRKANTPSALQFSFGELCENLQDIVDDINHRTYVHSESSCFGIIYPTAREIYAAQFRDRIVQHFYVEEIDQCLNAVLIQNTTSCRKGKGTDYALQTLNRFLIEESEHGTKDCFFTKIDLSGYFMSINRKKLTEIMTDLIMVHYNGNYKPEILYLTPIIFMNNPAKNRVMKMKPEIWNLIPDRKKMNPDGETGLAIGNITAQHGSNMNLNAVDHYIVEDLGLPKYVRYVDDMVIVNRDKKKLVDSLPLIEKKLKENGQTISRHKTIIDTAYHGVKFLGKISYPYGYQKPTKESAGRVMKAAHELVIDENLLSKLNSQAGRLKHYAQFNLLTDYILELPDEVWNYVTFDYEKMKFKRIKEKNDGSEERTENDAT